MGALKRLGIVGTGNVGSSLVMELASKPVSAEVNVVSREAKRAKGAILDAGSAYPETASKFKYSDKLEGKFDLVVITAGLLPNPDLDYAEMLDSNAQIVKEAMSRVECNRIVVIASPVDELTQVLSNDPEFKDKQVVGFGGELDIARVKYELLIRGMPTEGATIIGEHGPNMVPIYQGEENYDEIKQNAATTFGRILKATGKARNIATGVMITRLIHALDGKESVMAVSLLDNDYGNLALTWPRTVNEDGVSKEKAFKLVNAGKNAQRDLEALVSSRLKK